MTRQFSGTIKVEGGTIASCVSVGLKRDAKKQDDGWQVAGSRKELTFSFRTATASDGFDFKLEGDTGELEFDLSIDKEKRGQFVFVGNKQQHPAETRSACRSRRKRRLVISHWSFVIGPCPC